jgi:hypothetical protein
MVLDFTDLATAIIVVFGLVGWFRGVRRVAIVTGGIFFAMVTASLVGPNLIQGLARIGFTFHPAVQSDLFLAVLFVFTVFLVQLAVTRLILEPGKQPLARKQRLGGAGLGLVNGLLVIANVVRYADPYLNTVINMKTGGWTWSIPFLHISHPNAATVVLSIQPIDFTITPSPLLKIYDTLPTALIVLFGFLIFVFVGTTYGRVLRSRR